jgi:hypothetical protein
MLGRIISQREVAARWSYAEVTGRFGNEYKSLFNDPESVALLAKVEGGVSFDHLDETKKDRLATWFSGGYRRDYANALNGWYRSFRCESWTKSQLARVHTLPIIDPLGQHRSLTLFSYLAHPRRRRPNGELETNDPAVAADAVPLDQQFMQTEPLIVGH